MNLIYKDFSKEFDTGTHRNILSQVEILRINTIIVR